MTSTFAIVSHEEHRRLRKSEAALVPDSGRFPYLNWLSCRTDLTRCLSTQWRLDDTGFGDGDLYVGDDWFGVGSLHIVVLHWDLLTSNLVCVCQKFLSSGWTDYLITIGKTLTGDSEPNIEVIVKADQVYMRIYGLGEADARVCVASDDRLAGLRPLAIDS